MSIQWITCFSVQKTKNTQLHAFDYTLIKKVQQYVAGLLMMIVSHFNFLRPWLILSIHLPDF